MRNLERICAGTNFSPEAEIAVQSAATLARATGAQLHLLHVVHRPALYERVLHRQSHAEPELVSRASEHLRESTNDPAFAGLTIEHHVRIGTPDVELVAACTDLAGELLV